MGTKEGTMPSIADGPHYEIAASELATWIEQQGADLWWNVDGDPLVTGRIFFPAPGDELAAEIRAIGRPLLVQASADAATANGQPIPAAMLNEIAVPLYPYEGHNGTVPPRPRDRFLSLCWKGAADVWLLIEDRATAEQMSAEAAVSNRE